VATPLGHERRQSSSTGSGCAHDPIIGFVLDEAHINTDPVTGNIAVTQVYGNFNGSVNQDPSVSYSSSPDALNFQGNTWVQVSGDGLCEFIFTFDSTAEGPKAPDGLFVRL
jgi:hypothetical protein